MVNESLTLSITASFAAALYSSSSAFSAASLAAFDLAAAAEASASAIAANSEAVMPDFLDSIVSCAFFSSLDSISFSFVEFSEVGSALVSVGSVGSSFFSSDIKK